MATTRQTKAAMLRAEMRDRARQLGLPHARVGDVVAAVHELAANAVRHGGGTGRLRVWNPAGALHCQVDDRDLIASADLTALTNSLPNMPGHGLWLARQVADQMQALSGPRGTRVRVTFACPPPGFRVRRQGQ